jgi:hypothetical protein
MKVKKCAIFNYIPHKTPTHTNYSLWVSYYQAHLIEMYDIINNTIKNRYTEMPDINFSKFCLFIFNKSSKHIQI